MENEESLQSMGIEEQDVIKVTGGGGGGEAWGMAKRAIGWAGINGSVGAVIANHKGKDVDKAVAVNAAIGAGVSVAVDGVAKVIMKR